MFPGRYFAPRFFAPRFFPKIGAAPAPPVAGARVFLVNNGEIIMTAQGGGSVGYAVLLAQAANISSTPVFTADLTGLYRVNVSSQTATVGAAGTLAGVFTWGAYTRTAVTGMSLTALSSRGYTQLLYLTAADVVSYSTTITGGVGSPTYDFFITVERVFPAS